MVLTASVDTDTDNFISEHRVANSSNYAMHSLDQATVAAISVRRFVHFATQQLLSPSVQPSDKNRIDAVPQFDNGYDYNTTESSRL